MDLSEELRVVKDIWDCKNVVDGDKIDRIAPRNEENELAVEMNTQHQDREPGSQEDDWIELESVERDWSSENDVEGTGYNGRWCRKGGATSATHCDSKRIEMAGYQTSQHEQCRDTTNDVPGSSISLPNHHRQPCAHLNPPRR